MNKKYLEVLQVFNDSDLDSELFIFVDLIRKIENTDKKSNISKEVVDCFRTTISNCKRERKQRTDDQYRDMYGESERRRRRMERR